MADQGRLFGILAGLLLAIPAVFIRLFLRFVTLGCGIFHRLHFLVVCFQNYPDILSYLWATQSLVATTTIIALVFNLERSEAQEPLTPWLTQSGASISSSMSTVIRMIMKMVLVIPLNGDNACVDYKDKKLPIPRDALFGNYQRLIWLLVFS